MEIAEYYGLNKSETENLVFIAEANTRRGSYNLEVEVKNLKGIAQRMRDKRNGLPDLF